MPAFHAVVSREIRLGLRNRRLLANLKGKLAGGSGKPLSRDWRVFFWLSSFFNHSLFFVFPVLKKPFIYFLQVFFLKYLHKKCEGLLYFIFSKCCVKYRNVEPSQYPWRYGTLGCINWLALVALLRSVDQLLGIIYLLSKIIYLLKCWKWFNISVARVSVSVCVGRRARQAAVRIVNDQISSYLASC